MITEENDTKTGSESELESQDDAVDNEENRYLDEYENNQIIIEMEREEEAIEKKGSKDSDEIIDPILNDETKPIGLQIKNNLAYTTKFGNNCGLNALAHKISQKIDSIPQESRTELHKSFLEYYTLSPADCNEKDMVDILKSIRNPIHLEVLLGPVLRMMLQGILLPKGFKDGEPLYNGTKGTGFLGPEHIFHLAIPFRLLVKCYKISNPNMEEGSEARKSIMQVLKLKEDDLNVGILKVYYDNYHWQYEDDNAEEHNQYYNDKDHSLPKGFEYDSGLHLEPLKEIISTKLKIKTNINDVFDTFEKEFNTEPNTNQPSDEDLDITDLFAETNSESSNTESSEQNSSINNQSNDAFDFNIGYLSQVNLKRDFKNFKVPFEWNDIPMFSIITARNGAGKTRLLELILRICQQKADSRRANSSVSAETTFIDLTKDDKLSVAFIPTAKDDKLEGTKDDEFIKKEPENFFQYYKNACLGIKYESNSVYHAWVTEFREKGVIFQGETDLQTAIYQFVKDKQRTPISLIGNLERYSKYLLESPDKLEVINKHLTQHHFKYIISKNSYKNYQQVFDKLEFTTRDSNLSLQYRDLSPGEQLQILVLFWLFDKKINNETTEPSILLIDEPDAHLHPSLIKDIMKVIAETLVHEYKIQVIMTTHRLDTIVLAPDNATVYFMRDKNNLSTIEKVHKLQAMFRLTGNLRELIDYHHRVYTESTTDAQFYEGVYSSLKALSNQARAIKKTSSLMQPHGWNIDGKNMPFLSERYQVSFYASSEQSKNSMKGNGGCEKVKSSIIRDLTAIKNLSTSGVIKNFNALEHWRKTRKVLTDPELYKSYGIFDCDYQKDHGLKDANIQDYTVILERHSLENYLFDPIIFCSILEEEEIKNCIANSNIERTKNKKRNLTEGTRFSNLCIEIKNLLKQGNHHELQDKVNLYFQTILKTMARFYEYSYNNDRRTKMLKQLYPTFCKRSANFSFTSKKIGFIVVDTTQSFFLEYPIEILDVRGHDIEDAFFGEKNSYTPGDMIAQKVFQKGLQYIPFDLADIFFRLDNCLRNNINKVIKSHHAKVSVESLTNKQDGSLAPVQKFPLYLFDKFIVDNRHTDGKTQHQYDKCFGLIVQNVASLTNKQDGEIHDAFTAPVQAIPLYLFDKFIVDNRHTNGKIQHEYDKRFGLIASHQK